MEVGSAGVAVIDVVGVLPNVHSQQGMVTVGERIACVRGIEDSNVLVLLSKPSPSRAEVSQSLSGEFLDEVVYASPLAFDELLELSSWFSLVGGNAMPVESVVPMLGGIVEDLRVLAAE